MKYWALLANATATTHHSTWSILVTGNLRTDLSTVDEHGMPQPPELDAAELGLKLEFLPSVPPYTIYEWSWIAMFYTNAVC